MSRRPSPFAAQLRRRLLQRPGITRLPVCGACGRQTEVRNFGREHCKACEAERAQVSDQFEQQWKAHLDAFQAELVRERIYFRRHPADAPVNFLRCRHAVTQSRQCDGPAKVLRGDFWVCPAHTAIGR